MELFHVTTPKLITKYQEQGQINNPVRAWTSISAAERFARQTERRVILRITAKSGWRPLGGHQGQAMIKDTPLKFPECIL